MWFALCFTILIVLFKCYLSFKIVYKLGGLLSLFRPDKLEDGFELRRRLSAAQVDGI